ncbi:MAG: Wss1p-related putative metallopeptidase [Acidobacteriota bacterium]|nr:Wss1p-related putative metallopeptidase [Acidobacteriota bacterium]
MPIRPNSVRIAREEEDHAAMVQLRTWADELVPVFRLRYTSIEAEDEGVNEHYGVCYSDGVIRIRLRHAVTGRHLKESSLVDTLCHELAHLRYMDHSIRFQKLYHRILEEARRRGIYRPGPVERIGPVQCGLFEEETG